MVLQYFILLPGKRAKQARIVFGAYCSAAGASSIFNQADSYFAGAELTARMASMTSGLNFGERS